MKPEDLRAASREQLNLVLSFFSRVESKLSVMLAVDTGMLAVLGADAPPLKTLTLSMSICAITTLLLLAASVIFLYRGAFPALKGGNASLVYFNEIAKRTEHKFIEEFKLQTEEQYINDLLGQTWRNSEILKMKFHALKIAFTFLALGMIPWVLSLALFAANSSSIRTTLFH